MPDIVGLNRIFENKQLAIESFGTLDERQVNRYDDGKQVLARYYNEEGNVASLIGIYHYKRTEDGVDYGNVEVKDYSMNDVEYITTIIERVRDIEETIEANTERIDALRARLVACCGEPEPEPPVQSNYLTFTNNSTGPAKLILHDLGDTHPVVYYSLDEGETFTLWQFDDSTTGTRSVLVDQGRNVKLYGDNPNGFSFGNEDDGFSRFEIDSDTNNFSWDCSGNIMTLISIDEPTEIPNEYCFYGLFWQSMMTLHSAPELPATTLKAHCYQNMFTKCMSLENLPDLPATEIPDYAYASMFQDCMAITGLTSFPATSLGNGACQLMFHDCPSLVTIPSSFTFTELGEGCCSNMFSACSSITEAPYLPAETLSPDCYFAMFAGCTLLSTVRGLPAMDLAYGCYEEMFRACTSLSTIPELPARVMSGRCYAYMFNNSGVENGGFYIITVDSLAEGCFDGMFCKCRNLQKAIYVSYTNYTPADNTLVLPDYACRSMYADCQNLIDAGEIWWFLVASVGESSCESMFSGCTNLQKFGSYADGTRTGTYDGNFAHIEGNRHYKTTVFTGSRCYAYMFYKCTSLTYLWGTFCPHVSGSLTPYCYSNIFKGCTNLLDVVYLNGYATFTYTNSGGTYTADYPDSLAEGCFQAAYCDCSSLDKEINSFVFNGIMCNDKTLRKKCCYDMFNNTKVTTFNGGIPYPDTVNLSAFESVEEMCCCQMLTRTRIKGIQFPIAGTLATECYDNITSNCSYLSKAYWESTATPTDNDTSTWWYGLASPGTLYKNASVNWPASLLPSGWSVVDI